MKRKILLAVLISAIFCVFCSCGSAESFSENDKTHRAYDDIISTAAKECPELMFYMKDISDDGFDELFLGEETEQGLSIIAVYTYNQEDEEPLKVSSLDEVKADKSEDSEIYLCTNNLVLEGGKTGGEFFKVYDCKRMNWAAFRKGQDEDVVIDTNTLDWKPAEEW